MWQSWYEKSAAIGVLLHDGLMLPAPGARLLGRGRGLRRAGLHLRRERAGRGLVSVGLLLAVGEARLERLVLLLVAWKGRRGGGQGSRVSDAGSPSPLAVGPGCSELLA